MYFIRCIVRKSILNKSWHSIQTLFHRKYNNINFEDIPDVSPTSIRKILKQYDISFEEGYTSFITPCLICGKPSKSTLSSNKFYINKTTGFFMCVSCKSSGQWNVLQQLIMRKGKKSKKEKVLDILSEAELIGNYLESIKTTTVELKTLTEESRLTVINKFKLPNFSSVILDNISIRTDEFHRKLYFPLENVQMEIVGYKVFNKKMDDQVIEPSPTCGGILIGKSNRVKDTAVLVPNIFDFLVLVNAGISRNIICLPNGVLNLPQYILPSFERFNKIILWFGDDLQSWDAARNFAKKLGEKRCCFIRPLDKYASPRVNPNQDFKAIISTAQPIWHKSITTFSSLRQDVLSDLQNIDKVQGVKWKRFPTLSKILKGHRKGELTVITGPTGSGKTTFISEYSLDLALQGVSTLWGSFEIRNARLARTMLQQLAGIPLDSNLQQFDHWADQLEKLPVYFMTFHGQQVIKVVMEAVEHATYVHDITHIIIDNVQFMMGISDDARHTDRFWKQDVIVAAFRNFATRKNCHVTLVIHPRKERDDEDLTTSSIFGGAKASQEADNVLIIQDKRLTSVRGKKYLQIAKNRYSGDLGIMPLEFEKAGLTYAQKTRTTKPSNDKKTEEIVYANQEFPNEPNL